MSPQPLRRVEIGPWLDAGKNLGPIAVESYLRIRNRDYVAGSSYCIYLHVPFCTSRCSYCALYTFALKHSQDAVLDRYLELMQRMIASHPNAYAQIPAPTTVHFGGGTPLLLGVSRMSRLVESLREAFGDSKDCEWAVETTTSAMTEEMCSALKQMKVRRIHLGIQTLNDDIRRKIRRRESAAKALSRILYLKHMNFRLSVDLILGLEGQTETGLMNDLETLYGAGVRMFSVCTLRTLRPEISSNELEEKDYFLWCLLWNFMEKRGLSPIHFGQFGKSAEDNLYYTHPARNEDCIALGPYAHGSAGSVAYGNLLLKEYYKAIHDRIFPIGFGVFYHAEHKVLLQLERELLAHRVSKKTVDQVFLSLGRDFGELWDSWLKKKLLLERNGNWFQPSMAGSWWLGNMISDSRNLVKKTCYV